MGCLCPEHGVVLQTKLHSGRAKCLVPDGGIELHPCAKIHCLIDIGGVLRNSLSVI